MGTACSGEAIPRFIVSIEETILSFCCEVIGCNLLRQPAEGSSIRIAAGTSKPMQIINRHPILPNTGVED